MEIFLTYLKVFLVGGAICVIGQVLINLTKMTSARILVIFLLIGVVLQAVGVFESLKDFAAAGITTPITGFGALLAKGAMEGAKTQGLYGALVGGTKAAATGIGVAVFIGFVIALFSKSKSKT